MQEHILQVVFLLVTHVISCVDESLKDGNEGPCQVHFLGICTTRIVIVVISRLEPVRLDQTCLLLEDPQSLSVHLLLLRRLKAVLLFDKEKEPAVEVENC